MTIYFIFIVLLISFSNGQRTNQKKCSSADYNPQVSKAGQYPWVVAILDQRDWIHLYIGVGSLIAKNLVLTSVRILNDTSEADLLVRGGEYDYSTDKDQHHDDVEVEMIRRHEGFDERTATNNIALLVLKSAFDGNTNVGTICLPPPTGFTAFDGSTCFFNGWGKAKFDSEDYPSILKKTDITVISREECVRAIGAPVPTQLLCGTGLQGKDSDGDGGAPLVCIIQDQFYQVGIVNWGKQNATETKPIFYTKLEVFRSWIDQQIVIIRQTLK
ncbi:phenoloxidase-activating factor 2 [Drosophila rhopaloa]|uniref:Chymotrypsinogen A n=1 Tax=Drosophila rhopaloa TaxID=1041015 RepID=A0A6P4EUP9_DRORH|nr:phenoloxidase-activating factor 2 [Drosophila rhopaloa]